MRVPGICKGPVVGGNIVSTREEDGAVEQVRGGDGLDESGGHEDGEKWVEQKGLGSKTDWTWRWTGNSSE